MLPSTFFLSIRHMGTGEETYAASADVSDFSTLDDIVQSSHDLLPWRIPVQSVNLEHINVSAQSSNTSIDSIENMLSAQTHSVHHFAIVGGRCQNRRQGTIFRDTKVAFRKDHHLVAGNRVLLQCLANDLFTAPVRVDVCGVPS
jgi:hypothetical protein